MKGHKTNGPRIIFKRWVGDCLFLKWGQFHNHYSSLMIPHQCVEIFIFKNIKIIRGKFKQRKYIPIICCFGRIRHQNNVAKLVRIATMLPNNLNNKIINLRPKKKKTHFFKFFYSILLFVRLSFYTLNIFCKKQ